MDELMRLCSQGNVWSAEENNTSGQRAALDRFLVSSKCRRHDRVALFRHTMYYAIATAAGETDAESIVAQFRGKPAPTVQIAAKQALEQNESLTTLFSPTERTKIMQTEVHKRKRKRAAEQVTLQVHVSEEASDAGVSPGVPTASHTEATDAHATNGENVAPRGNDETHCEPGVDEARGEPGVDEAQGGPELDQSQQREAQDGAELDQTQQREAQQREAQGGPELDQTQRHEAQAPPLPPVGGQRPAPLSVNTWTYQESVAEQYRLLRNAAAILQANGAAPLDVAEMQVNLARLLAGTDVLLEPWERTLATLR
jgi:hypothetical protein